MIGVGGFLGVGEHLVAVPFDKVKFVNEPVAYTGMAGGAELCRQPAGVLDHHGRCGTSTAPAAAASKPNPWYPDHAVFSATKEELKAMPQFKYAI